MLAALVACLAVPTAANAATLTATPSNLSSAFSSAQAGDVIELASGSYGNFSGGSKSGTVTIRPQTGATASIHPALNGAANIRFDNLTITGAEIFGSSHDIAIVNSKVTASTTVGNGSAMNNANILFDNDTFDGIDACGSCYEGRLTVRGSGSTSSQPMGVTITNSHFGNAGESDGVQIIGAATGVKIGPGNEFVGIRQGGYSRHVDSIQLYGSSQTQIVGNYFHNNDTILMAPDGGDRENVSNNVMVGSGDYQPAVQFGHHNGSTFIHNTTKNIDVNTYVVSGDSSPNRNMVSRDNIVINGSLNASGCSACTVSYNLFTSGSTGTNAITGTPVFVGGTAPTTYAGWALKDGSPGKANASDGTDRGINVSGGTPVDPPADTTPPDTTIASGPSGTITTSNASFGFTSNESGSTFQCKIDAGSYASCTSPKAYTGLTDGSHTFSVRATDAAGNVDASAATATFTVDTSTPPPADTTAPDTTISSGPSGTITTSSASFGFTSSESGSTFECKIDAGSYASCTSPKAYTGLANGSHTFSVRATDAAGNTDASAATSTFTVNVTAPDTTAPNTTISSGPSGTIATSSASFGFTSSESGSTFRCKLDSGSYASCTSPKTYNNLTDGSHTFSVRATDAAGNQDASAATRTFTVDTTPSDTTAPETTISSGPSGTINDATPAFGFSSSESGSTFQCKVDAAAWSSCTSPKTIAALADGAHTFSVRATDGAGNTDASPATRSVTVDTTAPKTTLTSAPQPVSLGSSATLAFGADEDNATFECQIDGGAWADCTSPATFTGLALGNHTAAVRATDAAGNAEAAGPSASWLTVALPTIPEVSTPDADTDAPDAPDVPDTDTPDPAPAPAAPVLTLVRPTIGSTFTSKLSAAATAADSDGVAKVEFWVDNTRVAVDKAAPYSTSYTAPRSLSYGNHTLSVRAFDKKGAASSVAIAVTRVKAGTTAKARTSVARVAAANGWRISSAAVGSVTQLDGLASAGRQQTITYTKCSDTSGKVLGTQKVRSDAAGKVSSTLPTAGACVLKVA
ncbi:Ig-like domain-containing protein [Baekduia sp. Peel2402]|uniref:Ig-like domain-containing protein n=1 Tax=Baekduia sp. Peel2402 TaxID=3458296 RepID=UPI00403E5783